MIDYHRDSTLSKHIIAHLWEYYRNITGLLVTDISCNNSCEWQRLVADYRLPHQNSWVALYTKVTF